MAKSPRRHGITQDAPNYLAEWAEALLATAGRREARRILADYKAIAGDPKTTKHGREIAEERIKVLERLI